MRSIGQLEVQRGRPGARALVWLGVVVTTLALVSACAARRPVAGSGLVLERDAADASDGGLVFVRYPPAEIAKVKSAHLYKGKPVCQACHAHETPALLRGPIHTCERCHPASQHSAGHEAGTRLEASRVGGLPLVKGVVVCHTCHDPHDLRRNRHGLRLRVNELCLSCHAKH